MHPENRQYRADTLLQQLLFEIGDIKSTSAETNRAVHFSYELWGLSISFGYTRSVIIFCHHRAVRPP